MSAVFRKKTQFAIPAIVFSISQLLLACETDFSIPRHALLNHVIKKFQGVTSHQDCMNRCILYSGCYSVNHYSSGVCELNDATHLSRPLDLQPCIQPVTYAVISSSRDLDICNNQYCGEQGICKVNSDRVSYRCQDCSAALGMEDGTINDSQITASSQYNDHGHDPWKARLNFAGNRGSWVAGKTSRGEFVQVDFIATKIISKVAIQGRGVYDQWVTKFSLMYSNDGSK